MCSEEMVLSRDEICHGTVTNELTVDSGVLPNFTSKYAIDIQVIRATSLCIVVSANRLRLEYVHVESNESRWVSVSRRAAGQTTAGVGVVVDYYRKLSKSPGKSSPRRGQNHSCIST